MFDFEAFRSGTRLAVGNADAPQIARPGPICDEDNAPTIGCPGRTAVGHFSFAAAIEGDDEYPAWLRVGRHE